MNLEARAEAMLTTADKFDCRRFVRAKDVVGGKFIFVGQLML
jgi:hypothetical protein